MSTLYPLMPPPPTGPATEFSSIKELEELIGEPIPKPSYLPEGCEIRGIYKIGTKPERGEMPSYLYLIYSDEELNIGKVTSVEDLRRVLEKIREPGGYKVMLLWERHDQKLTMEHIEKYTRDYVRGFKEDGFDAELVYVNDMPAALKRTNSYRHTIVWMTTDWTFWLSVNHHPEIALDELIKIAESVRYD